MDPMPPYFFFLHKDSLFGYWAARVGQRAVYALKNGQNQSPTSFYLPSSILVLQHQHPRTPRYVRSLLTVPTTAERGVSCSHEQEEALEKLKLKQNVKIANYYHLKLRQV